jgi:hypothetical protein
MEDVKFLNLDEKMNEIRRNPKIPSEQFDRLFGKKIKESVVNYSINDFVDTISEKVNDLDKMSQVDKMNQEFQGMVYGFMHEMNSLMNKNSNIVITPKNVEKELEDRI